MFVRQAWPGEYVTHNVAIHDARCGQMTLKKHGFQLCQHATKVTDWFDDTMV